MVNLSARASRSFTAPYFSLFALFLFFLLFSLPVFLTGVSREAFQALKQHCGGRKLTPRIVTSQALVKFKVVLLMLKFAILAKLFALDLIIISVNPLTQPSN